MVMRVILAILFFVGADGILSAQGRFDRKIIISDSTFYAVELHDQIGVLWKGNIDQALDSAQQFILPAGTKRRSVYLQPFSWDVSGNYLYAINFTEYSQNDRLTSLKSIPIDSLQLRTPETRINKYLIQAAFENSVVENYPFVDTYKNNIYMDDLFFDIAINGSHMYECIAIQNQLVMWTWDGKVWNKSATFPFATQSFFSMIYQNNELLIIDGKGNWYSMNHTLIPMNAQPFDMQNAIMIDNRDNHTIHFIAANACENTGLTLQEIINQFSIK